MKRSMFVLVGCFSAGVMVGCASRQPNPSAQSGKLMQGTLVHGSSQPDTFWSEKDPPIKAKTFFAAGQLAEAEGNYPAAVKQYEQACQEQKDYLLAEYRLGIVYSRVKDWPDAVKAWKKYIESSNGSASAWSNLGFTYELMGDPKQAGEAYKKGIARDGTSQPCRVNYGLLLARQGHIAEAEQQLQAVLTPAEVHYNLASVYQQQGRTKLAKEEYQKALKLDPQMNDARNRMAGVNFNE